MHFEIYREENVGGFQTRIETDVRTSPRQGGYRWRLVAEDGRVVGVSAETHTMIEQCRREIELVVGTTNATGIQVIDRR